MGGRGASENGRTLNPEDITIMEDLVSMREGLPREVDEMLSVGKDVHDKYGEDIGNLGAATIKEGKGGVLGFFGGDEIGINNTSKMILFIKNLLIFYTTDRHLWF